MEMLFLVALFIVSVLIHVYEDELKYGLRYAKTYIYLKILRRFRKRRFPSYDFMAFGQPEKNSLRIPLNEWTCDTPRHNVILHQENDSVFCWGVNRKSEAVIAYIARQPGNKVQCSLLLRLSDGRIFTLPEEHHLQALISEMNTFGSSRFKLQCLSPMRIWRLFFNGTLRILPGTNSLDCQEYSHVNFTFIWTASSGIFDFQSDISTDCFSTFLASSVPCFESPKRSFERLNCLLNKYEQPGMLLGTVKVSEEEEKEIYLWGVRGRYSGPKTDCKKGNFEQFYVNFENGAIIHIGYLKFHENSQKFVYGYLMRSDGFINPIHNLSVEIEDFAKKEIKYTFSTDGRKHILIRTVDERASIHEFQKEFAGRCFVKGVKMSLNGYEGNGFLFHGSFKTVCDLRIPITITTAEVNDPLIADFCLPLEKKLCQDSALTGGKGSCLAKLYSISKESASNFTVPNGIVLTTNSFSEFIKGSLEISINKFQENVWSSADENIVTLCQKIKEDVKNTTLPQNIESAIISSLEEMFVENLSQMKFAVRSSSTGEDTEQMSAAGQMETYLGVQGTEQILKAVKSCWASQFMYQAVEYKRQYGQLLNSPMAVIIQKMVPCDAAGVCFTCDPVSGNAAFISISGNFGLGESVVSASVEPDTLILERDLNNSLQFYSQHIGKKKKKIIMDESSGTKEVEVDAKECCINERMALCLGKIAVEIEHHFGSSRDIEWGVVGENIFLFQARPVTCIDRVTDFESTHWFDTYLRTDYEVLTKANIGEILPGAISPLSLDVANKMFTLTFFREGYLKVLPNSSSLVPYFTRHTVYAFNNCFFPMISIYNMSSNDGLSHGLQVALFGRKIDLGNTSEIFKERHLTNCNLFFISRLKMKLMTFVSMFISGTMCRKAAKKVKLSVPKEGFFISAELFDYFLQTFDMPAQIYCVGTHFYCALASSMWNLGLLTLLEKAKGDFNAEVYSDFAALLSNCGDVESADVPFSIEELGRVISSCINVEEFKGINSDEALNWLQTTKSEAGLVFEQFIAKHGHRAYKEFDVMAVPWRENPIPLIKILQEVVSIKVGELKNRNLESFSDILSNILKRLNFWQRLTLKLILPFARQGTRDREFSKSMCVKIIDIWRKLLKELSVLMVKEGRLPKKELLFFLSIDEISQLINNRSPILVSKAFHRWKVHSKLDKLRFPEIISGLPKPIELESSTSDNDGIKMTGTPVSTGVVTATACVIANIEESVSIQQGDILITYATDIAWSPYFPLLSGVVTELGGLISHGAVVAREYGLPCVVGLHGAMNIFKSGDIVVLDGNKGTVTKVK